ncbi:MAG TPA: hypothetical protein VFZ61_23825 [Polyangiales bacterium]
MRWVALLLPLLSAACARSILLGSECPDFDGPCPNIGESDPEPDGAAPTADTGTDAQGPATPGGGGDVDAGSVQDASVEPDASGDAAIGDAGAVNFPGIRNPSFELPPDAATPVGLDLLGLSGVGWSGCRDGMDIVSEIHTTSGAVVRPTEGNTFFADGLSADFTQSGLVQELEKPLETGRRYAFELDVWAELGNLKGEVGLKLGSGLLSFLGPTPLNCILSSFTELASTSAITPGGWETKCLSFSAPREATSITLLGYAAAPGNVLGLSGAQLFIDNIRPVAGCPQ